MNKKSKFNNVVSFTTSKKRRIATAIVLGIFLIALVCTIPYFKTTRISTNVGNRTERTGVLTGTPLVQRFVPTGNQIEYIEVHYADCNSDIGTIHFSIEDRKGNVVFSQDNELSEMSGDEYVSYQVNLSVNSGKTYYFKIFVDGVNSVMAPKLWLSNNIKDEMRDVIFNGQDPETRLQANVEVGYSVFHYVAFAISVGCVLLSAFSALLCLHVDEKIRRKMGMAVLLLMPLIMFFVVESLNGNSIGVKSLYVLLVNYVLYFIIYSFMFAIINKLRIAVVASNVLIFILAIINYYKLEFRGEPFSLSDVVSFGTAMNVAGEYEIKLSYMIVTTACIFMLITAIVSRVRYSMHHKRTRLITGGLSVAMGVLLVFALFDTDRYSASADSIMKKLGIVNNVWNQPKNYSDNGMLVALTMNAQYLTIDPPEVYSLENLDNVVDDVSSNYGISMLTGNEMSSYYCNRSIESDEMPNIICIMDESYSDFSQFDGVEISPDYSPFMDSMTNVIAGDLHVSTFGGGTANSEFEFLTGNSMLGMPSGSVPYQQYIDSETGSLARTLSNLGYSTVAVHPYIATGWNRPAVYEYMNFDSFVAMDDFEDPEYVRSYISDQSSFEMVTELYEEHEASGDSSPMFIFNVTMQNHGSYSKTYTNFEPDTVYVPDPGAYPEAEQYFSVARQTDAAVEYLVNYFENCDEPTVICFFGDHLPSFNDGFYEMLMGVSDTAQLDPEQMQDLYMTDFFIWANYGIQTPEITDISLNYLSTLLMQVAGIPLTEYQLFLTEMYNTYPVVTTMGVCDAQGNYLGPTNLVTETDLWNYYSLLEYNEVFEDGDRLSYVFDYPMYMAQDLLNELSGGSSDEAAPALTSDITSEDGVVTETTTEE